MHPTTRSHAANAFCSSGFFFLLEGEETDWVLPVMKWLFKKKKIPLCFEIIFDPQEITEIVESSCPPFTQLPLLIRSYRIIGHWPKPGKWFATTPFTKIQTIFRFYPFLSSCIWGGRNAELHEILLQVQTMSRHSTVPSSERRCFLLPLLGSSSPQPNLGKSWSVHSTHAILRLLHKCNPTAWGLWDWFVDTESCPLHTTLLCSCLLKTLKGMAFLVTPVLTQSSLHSAASWTPFYTSFSR